MSCRTALLEPTLKQVEGVTRLCCNIGVVEQHPLQHLQNESRRLKPFFSRHGGAGLCLQPDGKQRFVGGLSGRSHGWLIPDRASRCRGRDPRLKGRSQWVRLNVGYCLVQVQAALTACEPTPSYVAVQSPLDFPGQRLPRSPPTGGFGVIAAPLGVELRVQLAKWLVTIVAEEAAHPSFGSQRFSFVVGIDLRRQASGSEENVTAGLECPKFKAFAWLNFDWSYL